MKKGIRSVKKTVSKIVLFFLYRAFHVSYHLDSNIKKEIDSWEEGRQIEIQTEAKGPSLILRKAKGEIVKIKQKEQESDICIQFKSLEAAFLMLTGRLGVAKAYAEHRFILKGDISQAMSFVRCVDMIESYLFPKFITKHILKDNYTKQISSFVIYFHILFNWKITTLKEEERKDVTTIL